LLAQGVQQHPQPSRSRGHQDDASAGGYYDGRNKGIKQDDTATNNGRNHNYSHSVNNNATPPVLPGVKGMGAYELVNKICRQTNALDSYKKAFIKFTGNVIFKKDKSVVQDLKDYMQGLLLDPGDPTPEVSAFEFLCEMCDLPYQRRQ
jgi:hypothetical protein